MNEEINKEQWLEHPTYNVLLELAKELGICLDAWEYGAGFGTPDPEDGYLNVYYNSKKLEDFTLTATFLVRNDIDQKWHLENFEILQD